MAKFNIPKKKKRCGKGLEKDIHVFSVNYYGALKSENEIYFQMASLFKEVTHAEKNQDEKKLKNQWTNKILTANFSDIHGKSFINNI